MPDATEADLRESLQYSLRRLPALARGAPDPEGIQDSVIDAVVWAWEHWQRDGRTTFKTFCNGIVNRAAWRAVVYQRRRAYRECRHASIEELEHVLPPVQPCDLVPRETAERLRQAVKSLPTPQRVVVELYYYEGLTWTQIAQRVGVTDEACRRRSITALNQLRRCLSDLAD